MASWSVMTLSAMMKLLGGESRCRERQGAGTILLRLHKQRESFSYICPKRRKEACCFVRCDRAPRKHMRRVMPPANPGEGLAWGEISIHLGPSRVLVGRTQMPESITNAGKTVRIRTRSCSADSHPHAASYHPCYSSSSIVRQELWSRTSSGEVELIDSLVCLGPPLTLRIFDPITRV